MQTADLVLAISVPLVAMLAGWVGVEMSLIPPERQTNQERRHYRSAFILLMLVAIGLNIWQTARNAQQQDEAKAESQQKQGELTSKVSEQGGKLDAIAHFEQQFLTFVSQSQRPVGSTPDAATKAYEAMALAVMRMAQGSSAPSYSTDVHLHILYNKNELNGQTIHTVFTAIPNPPGANAATPTIKNFQLPGFNIHNSGSHISNAVSARMYFSKQVSTASPWELTPSDEPDFPVCFYLTGGISPIYVNAQETWNWMPFLGNIVNWDSSDIAVRLKVFYGAERPVIANFTIRGTN